VPLVGYTILVVSYEAQAAQELRDAIERAGADVVYAASTAQIYERTEQFKFDGAVLCWHEEAPGAVSALRAKEVPFCVFAKKPHAHLAVLTSAPVVELVERVIATLAILM
jgi:hypothetical protein